MRHSRFAWFTPSIALSSIALVCVVAGFSTWVNAAPPDKPANNGPAKHAPAKKAPAKVADAKPADALKKGKFRALVPGVEVNIPANRQEEDTYSTHDVVEITNGIANLAWSPKLSPNSRTLKDMATGRVFRRKVWYLEFTFKPVRMIWVDVPQETGKMQKKLIWYMVYHVKNTGGHLNPVLQKDGTYKIDKVNEAVTFSPHFVLEAPEYKKAYLDRVIPVAIGPIQQKEDPNRTLLNSVEISETPIAVSTQREDKSVWGVVTWEDVDPRIDFFSIYVQGLTNAYRWVDPPGAFKMGDPPGKGRVLTYETLLLNFWRPGEDIVEDQRIIQFGFPEMKRVDEFGIPKVDSSWIFR